MSLNYNSVQLAGRLCADPELKVTPSGIQTVRLRLAVNRRSGAGKEPSADFFNLVAWRETAEFVCKYFRKGSAIMVDGELHVNAWTAQDGSKRYDTEVAINRAYFVESKQDGGNQPAQTPATPTSVYTQPAQPVNPYADAFATNAADFKQLGVDDDLPF